MFVVKKHFLSRFRLSANLHFFCEQNFKISKNCTWPPLLALKGGGTMGRAHFLRPKKKENEKMKRRKQKTKERRKKGENWNKI